MSVNVEEIIDTKKIQEKYPDSHSFIIRVFEFEESTQDIWLKISWFDREVLGVVTIRDEINVSSDEHYFVSAT